MTIEEIVKDHGCCGTEDISHDMCERGLRDALTTFAAEQRAEGRREMRKVFTVGLAALLEGILDAVPEKNRQELLDKIQLFATEGFSTTS